jgi:hypothetical protein
MPDEAYIPVEEVAVRLGVSIRQASRYAAKVRTQRIGQRMFYHRDDIEEQARLKGIEYQASLGKEACRRTEKLPRVELMPPGDMLDYLRDRDTQVAHLQQQLLQAVHRIGELETLLQQRLLPEDADLLRRQLMESEADRTVLRTEMARLQTDHKRAVQPWWKKLFARDEMT